jgi:acetoin utilization deacetylase AcuC-like enzyme
MAVGLVWDERYLAHKQAGHPERPERLTAIRQGLEEAGLWNRLVRIQPYPATDEMLERVHSKEHIQRIKRDAGGKDLAHLDADTYAGPGSWDAAVPDGGAAGRSGDDRAETSATEGGVSGAAWLGLRPPGSGRPRPTTRARTISHEMCERSLTLPTGGPLLKYMRLPNLL